MDGKIVVYTAITGGKDHLKDEQKTGQSDFICFTDKDISSEIWNVKPSCDLFLDNNRNAKIHKVLTHQYLSDYEYSIWMDANIYLKITPEELIRKYLKKKDIAAFRHFEGRDCIYEEADICIRNSLDSIETIHKQIARYREDNYPEHNGLFECTVILRRHTKKIEELNNYWWSEISKHSRRDQISFNYVLSKLNIKPSIMKGHIKDNKYFRRIPHDGHKKRSVALPKIVNTAKSGYIDVIINRQTTYEGEAFLPGDKKPVPVKVAQRWNNNGIAHYFDIDSLVRSGKLNNGKTSKYRFNRHPKVSIIVLVRNELNYIKNCFDSINKYTSDYELIVVNNGGNKKTKDYLRSLKNFDLTVITNEENMGFSYGCNQGIKIAKHGYMCFLNSDTIVTPLWLDKLMMAYKIKKDCGIVGPSTSYCGSMQSIGTLSGQRHKLSGKEINKIADSLSEGIIKYDNLQGFCIVIKKEVLDKGGVFNYKRFKLGCTEEVELLWRLRLLTNCNSYWIKDAYVHHFGHVVFDELGIDPNKYNKEERQKWTKNKNKEGPQFVENDVEIKDKYVRKSVKQKHLRSRSMVLSPA